MRHLMGSLAVLSWFFVSLSGCTNPGPTAPPGEEPEGTAYIQYLVYRHHLEVTDSFFSQETGADPEPVAIGRNGRGLFFGSMITSTPLFLQTEADLLASYYSYSTNILVGGAQEAGTAVLRRYQGEGWLPVSNSARGNITGMDRFYYCTDEGEIFHGENDYSSNFVFQAPDGVRFNKIHINIGTLDIFAVGDNGAIFHRYGEGDFVDESIADGPDFVGLSPGFYEPANLDGIYAVGGDEIWIYIAGIWTRDYDLAPENLNDISYLLDEGMLAVGDHGLILKRDEFGWWDDYLEDDVDLVSIATHHGAAEHFRTAIFGRQGQLFRTGTSGWEQTNFNADGPWPILHTTSSQSYAANGNRLMEFNGDDWAELAVWEYGHQLLDLHVIDATHVWAVGVMADGLDYFVLFYDGVDWSILHQASFDGFKAIWSDAAGDNVFVTDATGTIWWRHDGMWETDYTHGEFAALNDLYGTTLTDLVAVGDSGLILRRGVEGWANETSGTTANLLAVDGPVIAGEEGTVLMHDGGSWSAAGPSWEGRFNDVWYGGPSKIMVVGDDATVFGFDGTEWTQLLTHLPGVDFLSVAKGGLNQVWIGGSEGYLLRSPE